MSGSSRSERVAAVVLAGGESARFGRPKQLLRVAGETLVHRATRAALGSGADETFVVTGAHADAVGRAVSDLEVHLVENHRWREGLAGSIRCGALAALARRSAGVLIVLADQPHVGVGVLSRVVRGFREEGRDLVACGYRGTLGAPALFAGRYRSLLLRLEGDRGAGDALEARAGWVRVVPFEPGGIDIDVEADWKSYLATRTAPGRRPANHSTPSQ